MFKIIREGNFRFPGLYGFLFRNCDTLPLSSNPKTLKNFIKAVDYFLQNGHYVLIYPEQAMWWNYRKPRPYKTRAFKFAVKNNVPIIPCFITMEDGKNIGPDGFPIQEYTVHIEKPIYPDLTKDLKDASEEMATANYNLCVDIYEKTYGKKLEY